MSIILILLFAAITTGSAFITSGKKAVTSQLTMSNADHVLWDM